MPKNVNSIKEEKKLEMKLKNSIVEAIFLFVYTCAILLFMWVREDALKHQWYKKYGLDRDIKPLYLFLQLDAKKEAFNKFEERLRTETNIKFSLVNIYKMNHKFTLACFATKYAPSQLHGDGGSRGDFFEWEFTKKMNAVRRR